MRLFIYQISLWTVREKQAMHSRAYNQRWQNRAPKAPSYTFCDSITHCSLPEVPVKHVNTHKGC